MTTRKTTEGAPGGKPDDTAELPAMKLDPQRADAGASDSTDSWASTDSWKLGPEQQRDLEREAEMGTLRSNLASLAESRGHLENSLRSLTMALRDLEERLVTKTGHASALEQQVQTLQETSTAQLRAIGLLEAARLSDQDAQQAMLLEHEARAAALSRAQAQVAELQGRAQAHQEVVQSLESRRQYFEAQLDEREQQLGDLQARFGALEVAARSADEAAQLRVQQLQDSLLGREAELAHATDELTHAAAGLAEAGQRVAVLEAEQQAAAVDLRNNLRDQLEVSQSLKQQLEQSRRDHEQAATDVKIAEERIRAADVELRNRDQRIEKLVASESEQKARAERFARRLAERDSLIQRLENEAESSFAVLGKIESNLARLDKEGSSLPRDLVARLLVRNDGNAEIVQVLGRRTLIGRGVDCQLQVDADFVSRRHALVLVMPDETVIEDLNSTNGVYVNGTRISRRKLAEGDTITIGKTVFRYLVKPVTDRGN